MDKMRIESEVKLDNGRKILVYASLNKDDGSDKCEVEFDSILPLDNNEEVTSEEIDEIALLLAYQYDDLIGEYTND
ncbi:MAG: hypothetical protein EB120_07720 [Proteobacteria bacterium]|nr:hypothetical protein [Pseudomonadota bacterium]